MSSLSEDLQSDLNLLSEASRQAGQIALKYFNSPNEVWKKHGNSPVSEADYAVDTFLKETLLSARPDYGWLSEETEDDLERLNRKRLFIVDPIDGTRGFLTGEKQWCISVSIVEDGVPVAGVLECPALNEHFTASRGHGAFLNDKQMTRLVGDRIHTITGSRKLNEVMRAHTEPTLKVVPFVPSLAYRIAMVASGQLDAALARSGAHDWDLAAADVLLSEVGGQITGLNGEKCVYNQKNPRVGPLLITGQEAHLELMKLAKTTGFLH